MSHQNCKVLFQCALKPDLALMKHGDLTEVGERGVTLVSIYTLYFLTSARQWWTKSAQLRSEQARVTLARAIYSSAQMLLLDDVEFTAPNGSKELTNSLNVFAALDVHTSQWIVDHCFRGQLVKGRTIIMAVCRRSSLVLPAKSV